jgi:plasmid stabilization system protein ParE
MASVTFLPAATADYEEAYGWYRARSIRAAARFEDAVEQTLSQIAEAPARWPFCDPRHRQHLLRRYPYSIVYRVEAESVIVVAIAHARRRFGYWTGR